MRYRVYVWLYRRRLHREAFALAAAVALAALGLYYIVRGCMLIMGSFPGRS
jgi:hypothetical protein